jgi:hypothetical protein
VCGASVTQNSAIAAGEDRSRFVRVGRCDGMPDEVDAAVQLAQEPGRQSMINRG